LDINIKYERDTPNLTTNLGGVYLHNSPNFIKSAEQEKNKDITKLLSEYYCMVSTYKYEGFGNLLIEDIAF
jgi:hypothetical protein